MTLNFHVMHPNHKYLPSQYRLRESKIRSQEIFPVAWRNNLKHAFEQFSPVESDFIIRTVAV